MKVYKVTEEFVDKTCRNTTKGILIGLLLGNIGILIIVFIAMGGFSTTVFWALLGLALVTDIPLYFLQKGPGAKNTRKVWEAVELVLTDTAVIKKQPGIGDVEIQYTELEEVTYKGKTLLVRGPGLKKLFITDEFNEQEEIKTFLEEKLRENTRKLNG